MNFISQNWVSLIPPAIVISAVAYFVRFLGRVIADQKPFADDRNWVIELSGIFFIFAFIIPIILGIIGGLYLGDLGAGHWIRLLITFSVTSWLVIVIQVFTEKLYDIPQPNIRYFLKFTENKEPKIFIDKFIKSLRFIRLDFLVLILVYIITREYLLNNFWWIIVFSFQTIFNFILIALTYSLSVTKLLKVTIYFIGSTHPLSKVLLLKVNEDNIRIRDKNKVVILNKDQILKIEQEIE